MAGVNKHILMGHLGRDPEIRTTQGGQKVASLSLAVSNAWRDKATGERKEQTSWHKVVILNEGLAKIAEQYLKKGSQVYVEGEVLTRKYADKDGIERTITETVLKAYGGQLVLLDRREKEPPPDADAYGSGAAPPLDDEAPF